MPNRYYGYYYYHPLLSFLSLSLSLLFMFDEWVLENRYRNQIYQTTAEAKTFKYLSRTKWKHITRKHGYDGHDGFKSLAMKNTMNLQKCLSY